MDFEIQTKNGIYIIVILIIILCILYVLNCIKIKKTKNKKCNCNISRDLNTSYNSKKNEEHITDGKKNKLCLCFAEWCGHSQNFLPEWEKIKNAVKTRVDLNTICVAYNCENNKNMCEKYNIRGYPTILLHKENDEIVNYNGPREMNEILKFLQQNV